MNIKNQYNYEVELDFLTWFNRPTPFPYFWSQKYENHKIIAKFDKEKNLPYILHNDKKLYLPRQTKLNDAKSLYKALLIESDANSPHRYTSDTFLVSGGDILFDVGAAEAWFTLDNIELVSHAYIFETSEKWIEPLNATFANYKDKVTIINKFASNRNSDNEITLDSLSIAPQTNVFIKIDVEGAEAEVIEGMQALLYNNKVKLALCTYHKHNDNAVFKQYFESINYTTESTNGYMLYPLSTWNTEAQFGKPSFRKGLLRCWKKDYYPQIIYEKNNLYDDEPIYKQLAIDNKSKEQKNSKFKKRIQRSILISIIILFIAAIIKLAV